jgi:transcriptional regulator with XRE-family HTH domain
MTKSPPSRRFGEKLRALRQQHGLTMQALAERLGTGSGYISQVENNQREPRAAFVFKVAQFFGVSSDVLLDDAREVGE